MKRLAMYAVALAAAGCASGDNVTRQELASVKAEIEANHEKKAAQLRQELTGVDQKYVTVQQLQMDVKKKLEDLDKLEKQIVETSKKLETKVDLANTNVIKVLEFEEKLLSERLSTVRGMIEELKKK
jgi:predicted nuclease with TOPRIM domain